MGYSFLTNHHFYDLDQLIDHLEIQTGQTVLDLGCGHYGYWSFPIAKKVGGFGEVYAIDISPDTIRNINQKGAELRLRQLIGVLADLEKLEEADLPKADLALLVNTLNQIGDRKKLLSKVEKLLKPKGKLLIVDWKINASPYGPPRELRIQESDFEKLLAKINFSLDKEFILSDDHFGKLLVKV